MTFRKIVDIKEIASAELGKYEVTVINSLYLGVV